MGVGVLRPPSARRSMGAFTILELLFVMGMMAVLMGIGAGYLRNIGSGSQADQSRAIVRETIFACKQSSNGGTRAIFDLRSKTGDPDGPLVVGAAIARPILTHDFESLDGVSNDYPLDVSGKVESVSGGYFGRAAKFQHGGTIVFEQQAAFAVTEGITIDVWLHPEGRASNMTVLEGEQAYELKLVQDAKDTTRTRYDVVLNLNLRDAGEGRSVGVRTEFRTKGGPFRLGQGWQHVQAGYDGFRASIRIGGVEHAARSVRLRPGAATTSSSAQGKRIVVPPSGAVVLRLSETGSSFVGLMDALVLGGVFRSQENERDLPRLKLVRPTAPPVRITFRNGRLDRSEHATDVLLAFEDSADPGGPTIEFRIGLYGTVSESLVTLGGRSP